MSWTFGITLSVILLGIVIWITHDILQRKHAILHNFPIIGHFRYWLEAIGPELRQYIVTSNDEERPFSRDERSWVYASSKRDNNYSGFGTDNDLEHSTNYLIIRHAAFPKSIPQPGEFGHDETYQIPCAKTIGDTRQRKHAFRPSSIINLSAMSFGSLSNRAIEALNRGAKLAGCWHNTGEGSISPYHQNGGDLVWQIGTGYFGCRDSNGRFDLQQLVDRVAANPVRALEIKLSQGAKPGHGGVLPAAKITPEIAQIRGIPLGKDCISPAGHREFHDVDSMLDFVERLADATGLPVGIKSAVGEMKFWEDLTEAMQSGSRGVDFITIDGGEGGTGAAPLAFADHVSLPFKLAFSSVYATFVKAGLHQKVVFIGSGRLGFPERALLAMGMGCDLINVAREAMLSIGCIQAQRCHTGFCPTGVATQKKWLIKGLDPNLKCHRLANYVMTLRKEMLELTHACGADHPAFLMPWHFEILDDTLQSRATRELFHRTPDHSALNDRDADSIRNIMNRSSEAS